ncbi:hypothetical protein KAM380_097320 [Aeromonas caviae]|nr:hypothetical protein KAM380_097320 [Aeromonas caviae]
MRTYRFKLHKFYYDDLSQDELEMKFKACAEDARNLFETADVSLIDDILSISVSDQDELSAIDCREKFKEILQQESILIGAEIL